jgi:ribose 5-phosphate isomerase A
MTQDEMKALVAQAALTHVLPGSIIGVGTGSTVNHFIDALATQRERIAGAVSSSDASTARLRGHGFRVFDAGEIEQLPLYVDGADEIDPRGHMIKGGGAALTREKIVADISECFLCIADASKRVDVLGRFPLPVEVIGMAVGRITRRFEAIGGRVVQRPGALTDNGHPLLDVHGLVITDPLAMETEINQWPGVVTVGIFARHKAQLCLLSTADGVLTLRY